MKHAVFIVSIKVGGFLNENLLKASVQLISHSECESYWEDKINDGHLCATGQDERATCSVSVLLLYEHHLFSFNRLTEEGP